MATGVPGQPSEPGALGGLVGLGSLGGRGDWRASRECGTLAGDPLPPTHPPTPSSNTNTNTSRFRLNRTAHHQVPHYRTADNLHYPHSNRTAHHHVAGKAISARLATTNTYDRQHRGPPNPVTKQNFKNLINCSVIKRTSAAVADTCDPLRPRKTVIIYGPQSKTSRIS